ncbi:polysaccharide pyruvyl transferase [Ulvibacter sp. MAR_2010_11]|nr:polysaccharide pyruvyl transferase [Ulvibacter sp. MAR_2010_11]
MVIGLGPDYNYDINNHEVWSNNNTKYASNHGASFISRTLIDYFNADFIDNFSDINNYREKYDLCVIAFATHITERRDVSRYADFIKALRIKTVAFSLGIQDYSASSYAVSTIHPSLRELLDYVIASSGQIGVRGPHTASVLIKAGYRPENIIRFGCPTIFSPLNRNLKIQKKEDFKKPMIVFHRTMAELNKELLGGAPLLGQDFLDELVFREDVNEDHNLKKIELKKYEAHKNGAYTLRKIKENGIFVREYNDWLEEIKKSDFVLGARLHGCLAAISLGIPAVMIARDIRVQEIAEFYKIPCIKYENVGNLTIKEIYKDADFTAFNELYPHRYDNFLKLMDDLQIVDHLSFNADVPENYWFSKADVNADVHIIYDELNDLSQRINQIDSKLEKTNKKVSKLITLIKKLPGLNVIKGLLK